MKGILDKVVHVALKHPLEGERSDYYFGSITAIYAIFTRERLGVAKNYLINCIHCDGTYENEQIKVKIGELVRNSQKNPRKVPINSK